MDGAVVNVDAIVSEWRALARGAVFAAFREEDRGHFIEALAIRVRQTVRADAIELLSTSTDPISAAHQMHEVASALSQGPKPPTFDCDRDRDEAMERYARARAWQICARRIDPTLSEVQPRWQWWR